MVYINKWLLGFTEIFKWFLFFYKDKKKKLFIIHIRSCKLQIPGPVETMKE